mmetsp:Transcript_46931/g.77897  ORF Transcript_46931/g.77897 Transcript_46931/m.77897 type:complete len:302 (-) Transcript_46931:316-1221(-)
MLRVSFEFFFYPALRLVHACVCNRLLEPVERPYNRRRVDELAVVRVLGEVGNRYVAVEADARGEVRQIGHRQDLGSLRFLPVPLLMRHVRVIVQVGHVSVLSSGVDHGDHVAIFKDVERKLDGVREPTVHLALVEQRHKLSLRAGYCTTGFSDVYLTDVGEKADVPLETSMIHLQVDGNLDSLLSQKPDSESILLRRHIPIEIDWEFLLVHVSSILECVISADHDLEVLRPIHPGRQVIVVVEERKVAVQIDGGRCVDCLRPIIVENAHHWDSLRYHLALARRGAERASLLTVIDMGGSWF